jgi:hypothetical protein
MGCLAKCSAQSRFLRFILKVDNGHKPLSQSMAFHIKLAATINAKAKPRGGFC